MRCEILSSRIRVEGLYILVRGHNWNDVGARDVRVTPRSGVLAVSFEVHDVSSDLNTTRNGRSGHNTAHCDDVIKSGAVMHTLTNQQVQSSRPILRENNRKTTPMTFEYRGPGVISLPCSTPLAPIFTNNLLLQKGECVPITCN